jgi:hypothetical protein
MWHKVRAQPSQSGVGQHDFLGRPARVWHIFKNRFKHVLKQVGDAQSRCGQETWPLGHPSWLVGLTSAPPELHFR